MSADREDADGHDGPEAPDGAAADDVDALRRTDPLIADPALPTGETGQIPRPGPEHSPWLVGLLLAAFASLISGLVTIAIVRDDGDSTTAPSLVSAVDAASDSDAVDDGRGGAGPDGADDDRGSGGADDGGEGTALVPVGPADSGSTDATDGSAVEPSSPTVLDGQTLPAPGSAVIAGATVPITASCAVHLPLAPADNDLQLSSYFVRTADGAPLVIDRRFDGGAPAGVEIDGVAAGDVVVDADEERGAFVARSPDGLEVLVHPDPGAGTACDDTLVTNEPGQLAFPHTHIVMASCASGALGIDLFATGIASEGGRFAALDNADGTVTLSYSDPEFSSELLDPAASAFESEGRLGVSGLVTNGAVDLDIAIDMTPARGRACTGVDDL